MADKTKATTPEELFNILVQENVNNHTEKKKDLTYLSWSWAWQVFKQHCPEAVYEVKKFTNPITGKTVPYMEDEDFGIMVFTEITACGQTHEMWLPVMDGANNAMKRKEYEYDTKSGKKTVSAATMFDINKTIMRCLTKNISMFGLGLYIYAGEDLPIEIEEQCTEEQIAEMRALGVKLSGIHSKFGVNDYSELTEKQAAFVITAKKDALSRSALNE